MGDPELTSLVEQAIESNLEMRLADARVREAIALRKGSFAELAPLIALDADYVHRRAARNSSADGDAGGGLSGSISQSASNLSGLGLPSANLRLGDNSATIRLPEPGLRSDRAGDYCIALAWLRRRLRRLPARSERL